MNVVNDPVATEEYEKYWEKHQQIMQKKIQQDKKEFCDNWLDRKEELEKYRELYHTLAVCLKKNDFYSAIQCVLEVENDE